MQMRTVIFVSSVDHSGKSYTFMYLRMLDILSHK